LSPLFGLLWAFLDKFIPREEPSAETLDTVSSDPSSIDKV